MSIILMTGLIVGDSMYTTIENDQALLVDTNDKAIRSSKIYSLCIDGEHYIKRLINRLLFFISYFFNNNYKFPY